MKELSVLSASRLGTLGNPFGRDSNFQKLYVDTSILIDSSAALEH